MYRENTAPAHVPEAPTWRARALASLDRYFPLWATLGLALALAVVLALAPPGFAPGAPWWRAALGCIALGALASVSVGGIPASVAAVTDVWRSRHRWRDDPEVVVIPGTFAAWVVLVWIGTALFVWAASGWDGRTGPTRDPLRLSSVAHCRVLATTEGWVCLPSDRELLWCLPDDRTQLRAWRTYTRCRP